MGRPVLDSGAGHAHSTAEASTEGFCPDEVMSRLLGNRGVSFQIKNSLS